MCATSFCLNILDKIQMNKILDVDAAEEQIYDLRRVVRYDIRELTIEIIVDKYVDGINYDSEMSSADASSFYSKLWIPDYQRDFTWDVTRQSRFIESILLGLPIPLIFVAENKNSIWEIVDGSQRIRTLRAFISGNLTLSNLEKLDKLNGFTFNDLDISRQAKFKNQPLRMIVLTEEATDDVKKDMFERINRGSDLLKPMEKRKGIYKGKFNDFIYNRCAKNELFIKLAPIDKWLEKRQEREELLLRYFALSEYYDCYPPNKGIASFLDEFLDRQNNRLAALPQERQEKMLDELYDSFTKMLDFVNACSEYGFRRRHNPQTKRAVFEAISVGVHLALVSNPTLKCDVERFRYILNTSEFNSLVMGNVAYKGAYTPKQVKERITYIANSLLQ